MDLGFCCCKVVQIASEKDGTKEAAVVAKYKRGVKTSLKVLAAVFNLSRLLVSSSCLICEEHQQHPGYGGSHSAVMLCHDFRKLWDFELCSM